MQNRMMIDDGIAILSKLGPPKPNRMYNCRVPRKNNNLPSAHIIYSSSLFFIFNHQPLARALYIFFVGS